MERNPRRPTAAADTWGRPPNWAANPRHSSRTTSGTVDRPPTIVAGGPVTSYDLPARDPANRKREPVPPMSTPTTRTSTSGPFAPPC